MELHEDKINELIALARQQTADEVTEADSDGDASYFIPAEFFGGNYDNTYEVVRRDGQIEAARDLLTHINVKF